MKDTIVIYMTGPTGAGKTQTMNALRKGFPYPAVFLHTDKVAQDLMESSQSLHTQLVHLLGFNFSMQNSSDRGKIRSAILGDPIIKNKLESLVHPAVHDYLEELIDTTDKKWVFIESALPIKVKYDKAISVICSNKELRYERILAHREITIKEVKSLETTQRDYNECYEVADFVIDTANQDILNIDTSRVVEWLDLCVKGGQTRGLAPLTGNPATIGHDSVIIKGLKMFDILYVLLAENPDKPMVENDYVICRENLPQEDRDRLVLLDPQGKFTVHVAKEVGAAAVVRGIRDEKDSGYERIIFEINRIVDRNIDFVTIFADPELRSVSSTIVRGMNKKKIPGRERFFSKYLVKKE